jgi:hypothetical protein
LKYLLTECSLHRAEALLSARDYAGARQELEAALQASETLGLRALQARSHYILGKVLSATGNQAGAGRHYGEATRLLEEMRAEAGTSPLLKRGDLAAIYAESTRRSQAPPG